MHLSSTYTYVSAQKARPTLTQIQTGPDSSDTDSSGDEANQRKKQSRAKKQKVSTAAAEPERRPGPAEASTSRVTVEPPRVGRPPLYPKPHKPAAGGNASTSEALPPSASLPPPTAPQHATRMLTRSTAQSQSQSQAPVTQPRQPPAVFNSLSASSSTAPAAPRSVQASYLAQLEKEGLAVVREVKRPRSRRRSKSVAASCKSE